MSSPAPDPSPRPRRVPRDLGALLNVTRKELRVSLRDRQTAVMTFVLPILMYPLMFWLMIQGFLVMQGYGQATEVRVGLALSGGLEAGVTEAVVDAVSPPDELTFDLVDLEVREGIPDRAAAEGWLTEPAEEPLDAVLWLSAEADAELIHDSTSSRSRVAEGRVSERLARLRDTLRHEAARALGLDPNVLDPLETQTVDLAPPKDRGSLLLSKVLPMLLVIMCIMGAFFPAVDLTAGERERGTSETTLLLPVSRRTVLQGKVLAVGTLAMIAIVLNLVAIGISAEHLLATLGAGIDVEVDLPVGALLAVAPLALLFALFTSAVLTAVAGHASSFQAAQALMGPTQLVFIAPAMISMMPGLELSTTMAFVPVLNVTLALEALLMGEARPLEYALTALALLAQAWVAITISVRLLSREKLALGEGPSRKKPGAGLRRLFGRRNG